MADQDQDKVVEPEVQEVEQPEQDLVESAKNEDEAPPAQQDMHRESTDVKYEFNTVEEEQGEFLCTFISLLYKFYIRVDHTNSIIRPQDRSQSTVSLWSDDRPLC